ncbi:acyltransferase family protein [Aquihabitans sp. McL0605]|uniref:acyltransferase family protein n=1 Tax=Aquihabitans sp. McL0605 TaxID=3415671 RepID=UPI003CF3109C
MSATTLDRERVPEPTVERRPAKPTFRPDVDALRAVAIVLVVLYHAHIPGLDGGFVGVDVFFVISGYLITRNLLAEHSSSGRIALGGFWARRLRRLVPAMSVMVLVTLVAGTVVLMPLRWSELSAQGVAASLYYANYHFAAQTSNYFATDVASSPLLHTWSLAVEEQFYLVWPLVFAGALAVGRRLHRSQTALVAMLAVLTVGSFAISTSLVASGSPLGFYGLPSRAWEFGVAGLLAVATTRIRGTLRPLTAAVLGVGGLVAILAVAHTYDASTPFPGRAALIPVFGTVAVIAAGSWSKATWVAAVGPLRWLGRVSYSWYLWHWPAMVLTVLALDHDTATVRLGAAIAALGVAYVSLRLLEDPIRRSPRLNRSGSATAAMAIGFTALALAGAVGVNIHRDQVFKGSFQRDLAAAADKDWLDVCRWSRDPHGAKVCTVGDATADRTIVVTGDSHAMSWTPAFDQAGTDLGLRVLVRAASTCPGVQVPTISEVTHKLNQDCVDYQAATRRLIDDTRPETVVLVGSDLTRQVADADGNQVEGRGNQLVVWADALKIMRDELTAQGATVGALLDNPRIYPEPLECMAETHDLEACGRSRTEAQRRVKRHIANERRVLGADATMDTFDLACEGDPCAIWSHGRYVYADEGHLTSAFTRAHADDVAAFLQRLQAPK